MRTTCVFAGTALAVLLALPVAVHASCGPPETMKGIWDGSDGGIYRVIDNLKRLTLRPPRPRDIWWVGTSRDGGQTFINVFKGVRRGNIVTGEWSDVRGNGGGTMELSVDIASSGQHVGRVVGFRKIRGEGFGGNTWKINCEDHVLIPQ